jgi:ribosomal protein S12
VIEIRKRERRDGRKEAEEEKKERMKESGEKKGVVLLRWGWPRKPKD